MAFVLLWLCVCILSCIRVRKLACAGSWSRIGQANQACGTSFQEMAPYRIVKRSVGKMQLEKCQAKCISTQDCHAISHANHACYLLKSSRGTTYTTQNTDGYSCWELRRHSGAKQTLLPLVCVYTYVYMYLRSDCANGLLQQGVNHIF